MIELPLQLVLLSKLNKLFNYQFLQVTDTNINFTHIDLSICKFLKEKHPNDNKDLKLQSHQISYIILTILLKKLMICALSSAEQPLRSKSNWIKNRDIFTVDKIMTSTLPQKLKKSFDIFYEELQTDYVYNDVSKINYLIHTLNFGNLEQTLARVIKCMTPSFIYDYYLSIKACYLYATLIECIISEYNKTITKDKLPEALQLIGQIAFMIYQNQVYKQNSKPRLLPSYDDEISNELQMYYLNHTLTGPQIYIVKMLAESSEKLFDKFK
jgi:hypothetical protein